jgi:biopolymer transport protein ExbB
MKSFISSSVSLAIALLFLMLSGTMVQAADPAKDLILYFSFDEGQGDTVKDASPNKFSGAIKNAKWSNGVRGKALEFDKGSVDVKPLKISPDELTIEFWFKPAFKIEPGPVRYDLMYRLLECGRPHITFNRGGVLFGYYFGVKGGAEPDVKSSLKVFEPKWYYFAATQDSKKAVLYINGEVDGETPTGGPPVFGYADVGLKIAEGICVPSFFIGLIDEVRIWKVALTAAEVKKSMADTLAVEASGKLATIWGRMKKR